MEAGKMTLDDVARRCSFEVLVGSELLSGRTVAQVFASDRMSDVLASAGAGALLVTGLVSPQSVVTAHIADAAGIVYVRGKRPGPDALDKARVLGVVLLATPLSTFDVCCLLGSVGLSGADAHRREKLT